MTEAMEIFKPSARHNCRQFPFCSFLGKTDHPVCNLYSILNPQDVGTKPVLEQFNSSVSPAFDGIDLPLQFLSGHPIDLELILVFATNTYSLTMESVSNSEASDTMTVVMVSDLLGITHVSATQTRLPTTSHNLIANT